MRTLVLPRAARRLVLTLVVLLAGLGITLTVTTQWAAASARCVSTSNGWSYDYCSGTLTAPAAHPRLNVDVYDARTEHQVSVAHQVIRADQRSIALATPNGLCAIQWDAYSGKPQPTVHYPNGPGHGGAYVTGDRIQITSCAPATSTKTTSSTTITSSTSSSSTTTSPTTTEAPPSTTSTSPPTTTSTTSSPTSSTSTSPPTTSTTSSSTTTSSPTSSTSTSSTTSAPSTPATSTTTSQTAPPTSATTTSSPSSSPTGTPTPSSSSSPGSSAAPPAQLAATGSSTGDPRWLFWAAIAVIIGGGVSLVWSSTAPKDEAER